MWLDTVNKNNMVKHHSSTWYYWLFLCPVFPVRWKRCTFSSCSPAKSGSARRLCTVSASLPTGICIELQLTFFSGRTSHYYLRTAHRPKLTLRGWRNEEIQTNWLTPAFSSAKLPVFTSAFTFRGCLFPPRCTQWRRDSVSGSRHLELAAELELFRELDGCRLFTESEIACRSSGSV